ncbi:hypothetical protein SCP_0300070 [Sparassis crispa]|uniref:Elongator complex protein n=1 Tax=Sparassis crispa TaxID=139825 RepID=A0A401GDN8_9APHY|nr:hypothetical protein SCP_0300070 [Sparassis crispa]GBE80292.1 hypothetical protein SCP_0300070 [Sparassis crispa]
MFPLDLPLPGEILLITDELASPADFLLHRSLFAHLKKSKDAKCIILSVAQDSARWKSIAGQISPSFARSLAAQSVVFLDAMQGIASPPPYDSSAIEYVKSLLDKLRSTLSNYDEALHVETLVILDDIVTLEWIGLPVLELIRFSRMLCALSRKMNFALILRYHTVTPGEPDELLRHLLQLCTYRVDVFPLSSGRSGAVSGQIALHAGPAVSNPRFSLVPRSAAIHYRLIDTGSVFFDRGTGAGVL